MEWGSFIELDVWPFLSYRTAACLICKKMYDLPSRVPFHVSFGILFLTNFIGNGIVCAVILRNRFMRTPVNYLLFNLAVADIMVGVFALPGPKALGPYFYTHPRGTLGDWFCKTITGEYSSLVAMALFVSTLTLSAVAYERFQAVVHPFTVKEKVTKRNVVLFIAFSWTVAFAAQIFALFAYHHNDSTTACEITYHFQNEFILYVKFLVPFLFGFPLISMIVFYGRVIRELRQKQNRILNREQLALNRVHKRITFMLITVTVIFAATWGAGAAISGWFVTYSRNNWHLANQISALLVAINSSVNCFLYTLFSSQFRKGVKNIFQFCRNNCPAEFANEANRHYPDKTSKNSRLVEQSNSKTIDIKQQKSN